MYAPTENEWKIITAALLSCALGQREEGEEDAPVFRNECRDLRAKILSVD